MEFVKRNLGFLASVVVFLILTVVLAVFWQSANRRGQAIEAKVSEQKAFMADIRREKFALNQHNQSLAAQNYQTAQKEFTAFLRELATRYGIPEESGINGLESLRLIKEECLRMEQELADKNVQLAPDNAFFSFGDIARSTTLPRAEDVPFILRNLRIVSEIVRVCGRSGISELIGISRPAGLKPLDKDLYTITPLQLNVEGSYKSIQRLVNQLQREAKVIVLVRSLELDAREQIPATATTAPGASATATRRPAASAGMPPGMMGMPPMMPPAGRAPLAADGKEKPAEPALPVDKEQRLVFSPGDVSAVLILDVLEFKKTAEEK
jgi:Tfp pilus assembly protein PilO